MKKPLQALFEKNMFWLVAAITVIYTIFHYLNQSYDLNRTIGWTTDLSIHVYYLDAFHTLIGFMVGYGLVYFSKRQNHYNLSFIHFLSILIIAIITPYATPILEFFAYALSWLLFLANLVFARPVD